ncbi:Nitrogen permease regulator 3, partial [Nowakowskiella sp. JEL0078]
MKAAAAAAALKDDRDDHRKMDRHITMFHLAVAVGTADIQFVERVFVNVVEPIATALAYEQRMRGYVSDEIDKILRVREDNLDSLSETQQILQVSSLAQLMALLHHSLNTNARAHLVINNSIDISLNLYAPPSTCLANPLSSLKHATDSSDTQMPVGLPVFRPYHTLLLLIDPDDVLVSLPVDANPLLIEFIRIVNPTQCFEELQSTLDCSLSQIYRLAAHLIHWQKAKIIDVIHARNMYVVNPDADLSRIEDLAIEFSREFSG